jgi:metallo-beta-lactamase family protein
MDARIGFFGAARNVTGSCYFVECGGRRVLVDCGLYQERDLKARNWAPFRVPPSSIDAVLLTHGHLDPCGLIPKLVREGFTGPIYATAATVDIARLVILDSARLQEEDAEQKRRRHAEQGREPPQPVVPLYTVAEAEAALPQLRAIEYGQRFTAAPGIDAVYQDAGHILGSGSIRLHLASGGEERTVLFSGDLGRWNAPILRDPEPAPAVDYIVVESTYGDQVHESMDSIPVELARVINDTRTAGGNLIIPSFAVERAQELLYHMSLLLRQDRIPHVAVFLDSPMAVKVTEIFRKRPELFDGETRARLQRGDHPCDFPQLHLSRTVDESKAINHIRGTVIVIAGSGMCTGGRIKHHLAANIGRPESTILFVGYQAFGTLGRQILDRAPEVRILGRMHTVRAQVQRIHGFSAHADRDELLRWLAGAGTPRKVFVTHGEPEIANAFATLLRERRSWNAAVPTYGDTAELL